MPAARASNRVLVQVDVVGDVLANHNVVDGIGTVRPPLLRDDLVDQLDIERIDVVGQNLGCACRNICCAAKRRWCRIHIGRIEV